MSIFKSKNTVYVVSNSKYCDGNQLTGEVACLFRNLQKALMYARKESARFESRYNAKVHTFDDGMSFCIEYNQGYGKMVEIYSIEERPVK